jgi:hypothetical protein
MPGDSDDAHNGGGANGGVVVTPAADEKCLTRCDGCLDA